MEDRTATLAELRAAVRRFAEERDWMQFHTPKNLSMALSAETAELMEHFLWADGPASHEVLKNPAKRREVSEELADVVIYALEFANVTGIDLAAAIEAKLAVNAGRYPVDKARGNSTKYTEL